MMDLHIHSNYSDGKLSIGEIVKMLKKHNISVLSITDHDNIESVNYIKNNNFSENIVFIPGVELSTESFLFKEKLKIHLLGYGFDYNNKNLNRIIDELHARRASDNKAYIDGLVSQFDFVDKKMFYNFDYGKYGWIKKMILDHISSYISLTDRESLEKYLKLVKPVYNSYNTRIEDAIELINNAGGYPILAHPFSLKLNQEHIIELIIYLEKLGLKGIETFHNDATYEQVEFYHGLALKYNLLESGGSDFHSENYKKTNIFLNENENQLIKKLKLENKIIGESNEQK